MHQGISIRHMDAKGHRAEHSRPILFCVAGSVILSLLSMLVPELRLSLLQLCNRLFYASEQVNRYVYARFPVPGEISIAPACLILGVVCLLFLGFLVLSVSTIPTVVAAAGLAGLQAYFGLSLPSVLNIGLYLMFGLIVLSKHHEPRHALLFCACSAVVLLGVYLLLPGTDPNIEAASEHVRDRFGAAFENQTIAADSGLQQQMETRHENLRSISEGSEAAQTGSQFKLITLEKAQIALPNRIDYLRIILLCLLIPIVLVLPFAPFLWINRQHRKSEEKRIPLSAQDPNAVIRCAFALSNEMLDVLGTVKQQPLYIHRMDSPSASIPEAYRALYHRCALLWQEAVYSDHRMTVGQQEQLMQLLGSTEALCRQQADRKTRFRLKYVRCLLV